MKKKNSLKKRFIRYMRRTWRNKLAAIFIVGVGLFTMFPEYDGTFFLFSLAIGIPLFFDTQSWFVD